MSSEHDSPENRSTLVLLIGRRQLVNQWQRGFITRTLDLQHLQGHPYRLYIYPRPPFFSRQAAHQLLLSRTHYYEVLLYISLLELDHHQCEDIFSGITTLLEVAPERRHIRLLLEYEAGNPEHSDAVERTGSYYRLPYFRFIGIRRNFRVEGDCLLPLGGDDGRGLVRRRE